MRRKQTSLRKLKRRFLLGAPISKENLLDNPRLEVFVARYAYRVNLSGNWIVKQ